MEKSFGLLFYLKKPKGYKAGNVPIYVRVTINSDVVEISTKQKCDPSKWNVTAGRVEGKSQAAKMVNDYLDVVQRKVYEIRKQLLDNDHPVTAENIKTVLHGKEIKEDVFMLMKIFQRHNDQMAELVGHDIGVDGAQWLTSRRQKTDITARIPLLAPTIAIIKRYESHSQCILDDLVLPVISNQKLNAYLKEIADLCGIKKVLTFHIARHTFATTVTLSNGVPIETVSKLLGHKNLKTTQHYAKILDRKISEDMKVLMSKFQ